MSKARVRWSIVGQFKGSVPDVPTAPGVDIAELTKGDDEPFYVTLPVAELDAVSESGLLFDETLVSAIEQQIVGKGANMGHISPLEEGSAFPFPVGLWVGVQRIARQVYAKAYIPPGDAREFFRQLKAVGGKIATSLFGFGRSIEAGGETWALRDFILETMDFAPLERAALKLGGAFSVTTQMIDDDGGEDPPEDNPKEGSDPMTITLADVPDAIRQQIAVAAVDQFKKDNEEGQRITQLEDRVKASEDRVKQLETEKAEAVRQVFDVKFDERVAELVKIEELRPLVKRVVLAMLDDAADMTAAENKLREYLSSDEFKAVAKPFAQFNGGPSAITAPHYGATGNIDRDALAKAAEKSAQAKGLVGGR